MYLKFNWRRVPPGWPCGLALVFWGCAGSPAAAKHEELYAELRKATPPTEAHKKRRQLDLSENSHLDRARFIRQVLARNPNIEVARQAWRTASAEYSQQTALEDPMLEYSFAPLSIGSADVPYGHSVTISQKFPWPGKLSLAGEVALAETEAARDSFRTLRLELALMASLLFDRYYAVDRSLELNSQHRVLVGEIKRAAEAQYEAGRAPQHEPLQAEMELAYVERQKLALTARRAVIAAQMNGLMHRPPEAPLPPPPAELDLPDLELADTRQLQKEALARRTELSRGRSELKAGEAARKLANRAYYPDFGVMASYSSMWAMPEHQWMLGLSLNLPLQLGRRDAAVEQSEARIAKAKASLASISDEIRVEVEQARQRLVEARQVIHLYRQRLLPAARAQIEAATAGYVTGRASFQSLIDAERSLRNVELDYQEALAALGQQRAELLRTLGRLVGAAEAGEVQ